MALRRCFIIGISGTTNSGKSTLAEMLCKNIPGTSSLCQDSYFYAPDDTRVPVDESGKQNWEDLGAIDMETMMQDVHGWIEKHQNLSQRSYLIVEGFMIFNHRSLSSLFDKKFFIMIDKDTCALRRSKRTYNPPDYPGYFENTVWPMYLKNLASIKDQKDIDFIEESVDLQKMLVYLKKSILHLETYR